MTSHYDIDGHQFTLARRTPIKSFYQHNIKVIFIYGGNFTRQYSLDILNFSDKSKPAFIVCSCVAQPFICWDEQLVVGSWGFSPVCSK